MISGIGNVLGLIFVGIFGVLSDKYNFTLTITLSYGIRAVGLIGMVAAPDVKSWETYVFMLLTCVGNISSQVTVRKKYNNQQIGSLLMKNIDSHGKGTVAGVFTLFASAGMIDDN
jgi:fucose permease